MTKEIIHTFYERILFHSNDNLDEYNISCSVVFGGIVSSKLETLFGQEAQNIGEIDHIIRTIKEVIDGKRENFFIFYDHSSAGFDVYQNQTKIIEVGSSESDMKEINNLWQNRMKEEYQYVDTQAVLNLYLDWRKFLIDRQDMVYVRKQKVIED